MLAPDVEDEDTSGFRCVQPHHRPGLSSFRLPSWEMMFDFAFVFCVVELFGPL